jgi:hypothetical protein
MTRLHSWITPSSLVLVIALVAGVVIFVVPFLGRLVLVVAGFSVLVSGAYYPSGCRILGVGLVSPLWGPHHSKKGGAYMSWQLAFTNSALSNGLF